MQVTPHLTQLITETGPVAAMRALQLLYGVTGKELSFLINRNRTMVSLYMNGHKEVPPDVCERLARSLESCIAEARRLKTNSESEDALLEAIIGRTEELLASL